MQEKPYNKGVIYIKSKSNFLHISRIILIFASQIVNMKKSIILSFCVALIFCSCAHEYNVVYKSADPEYKYEFAKELFVKGKFASVIPLLQDLVVTLKGTENGQESLYMLAKAEYDMKDYDAASEIFKKYYQSYPKGIYAEMAQFNIGQCLYENAPEPRLDQTPTIAAIQAFQDYLDLFPDGKMKEKAQERMFELQDKLVKKEYLNAKLYYNLGSYFGNCTSGGNNYEACVITAQNAINDYPYSNLREEFAILIMKSKFELAHMSVDAKKLQRFQDAEDECYGFINQFPDSKERHTAEEYIKKCKQVTKD